LTAFLAFGRLIVMTATPPSTSTRTSSDMLNSFPVPRVPRPMAPGPALRPALRAPVPHFGWKRIPPSKRMVSAFM
jgi:hypothetical protein